MSGACVYLGSMTVAQCVPLAATAQAGMTSGLSIAEPQISAQVDGLLELQTRASLQPPSLVGSITQLGAMVVAFEAALAVGDPGADFSVSAIGFQLVELQAQLADIQAQLAIAASFSVTLGTPGILAYRYEGDAGSMGSAVQAAVGGGLPTGGGPAQPCNALLLIASDGGAWAAISATFRT